MSIDTNRINMKKAEEAFAILDSLDHIQKSPLKSITYAEILYYVTGNAPVDFERIEQRLKSDLTLHRTYQKIVQKHRKAFIPILRTAADGLVQERNGDLFSLKWRPSKSHPDQMFLILNLLPGYKVQADKEILLHISAKDMHHRLNFPCPNRHKSQLILDAQSPVLVALSAQDTELHLV